MKAFPLYLYCSVLISSLLLICCQDPRKPILLYEKREGICSTFPAKCPNSKQLNGMCCKIKGQIKYYKNFCLACQDGCDSFVYKTQDNEQCLEEDL